MVPYEKVDCGRDDGQSTKQMLAYAKNLERFYMTKSTLDMTSKVQDNVGLVWLCPENGMRFHEEILMSN